VFAFEPRRAYRAARALALRGRLAEAEEIYRLILKRSPTDSVARHNLAVVLFTQGEVRAAHEMLKETIQGDSIHAPYFATMVEMMVSPEFIAYLNTPFIGPFNGQQLRQQIFLKLIELVRPQVIFETGTFRGTTTDFIARATSAHVFTCELETSFFRFATERFRKVPNITVVNLDTRTFLKRYVPPYTRNRIPCLFYLDAHWDENDLPLLDELRIVLEHAPGAIVMIDDFEVWDDPGYAFDDYGAAGRVSLQYLAPLAPFAPRYYFPISSAGESGMRRGAVVLTTDPALAAAIETIPELRPAPPPPQEPQSGS
jgi:predicted O-methyltransferase YrrM